MSWDAMLTSERASPPAPFGPADVVKAKITSVLPALEWHSDREATLRSWGGVVEVAMDGRDPVEVVWVSVYGALNPRRKLQKLCAATGWEAFDMQAGSYIERGAALDTWSEYKRVRDRLSVEAGASKPRLWRELLPWLLIGLALVALRHLIFS